MTTFELQQLPSISSTLNAQIFCMNVVSAAFFSYMYIVKAAKTTFVRECPFNIDEIDTWSTTVTIFWGIQGTFTCIL